MSCLMNGITLFISSDNKHFVFSTECIDKSPLNSFIPYYIDKTTVNGIQVIKISLLACIIQAQVLLSTGRPVFPTSKDYTSLNENVYYICSLTGKLEIITLDMDENETGDDDEIAKFIDDDNIFKDFDDFVRNSDFDFTSLLEE